MAEALAIALLTSIGVEATATAIAVTTAAIGFAASVSLSLLAQAFLAPKAPSTPPSDRQFVSKAPALPRFRSYGRVQIAGAQMFQAASAGTLHRVVAHNDGEIDGVEAHLVNDETVTVGGSHWVTAPPKWAHLIYIDYRTGTASPAAYSALTAAFSQWDATHLGRGIAHSHTQFKQVDQSAFMDTYPAGENTTHTIIARMSRVWDPRDGAQSATDPSTWTWSDNAALCILDFLRHATGMSMPLGFLTPELEAWKTAADDCDDPIALAAGGTEKRYRAWGTYSYDERPADVLARLLSTCNGRLWVGPSGGLAIAVGKWRTPTVTIGDDAITSYRIGSGNEGPEAANTLTAVYTEASIGYTEADAAPWVDEDLVAAYGEKRAPAQLYMVPSHGQCRRLMKQAANRLAPAWKGTVTTNLAALAVLSERWATISIAELDLTITVEIENVQFRIEKGSIVTGLIIDFTSTDAAVFAWDADTEEGLPSETPPTIAGTGLVGVANFAITIENRSSGGASYAVAVASWNPYDTGGLRVQVEYRETGSGYWLLMAMPAVGETHVESPALIDGGTYEFRAKTVGLSRTSSYSSIITRVITVDTVAPAAPTALSITPSGSTVTVGWTNPGSANTYGARVYRHTSNAPASATLVATRYGAPSAALTYADTGLAPGTYWWWVAAINGSGVESARTAAGTTTIT